MSEIIQNDKEFIIKSVAQNREIIEQRPEAFQNNKEVFFGVRPEHIFSKKFNESDFEITLSAELSEYIGHEQIVTFNYSNQEILAKFPSTSKIEVNKELNLYFDLTQISIFDKNSKERI